MAIPLPRVIQAQLENACGGKAKLLQLIDTGNTGDLGSAPCQAFIAEILAEGNSEVNALISPAVDITDPQVQTSPLLIRYELDIDVKLVWMRGLGGVAIPEQVIATDEYARGELEKIGARKKGIGLTTRPATSQPIQRIADDQSGNYFQQQGPRRRFDGWS